jgi:hypothetical protein
VLDGVLDVPEVSKVFFSNRTGRCYIFQEACFGDRYATGGPGPFFER